MHTASGLARDALRGSEEGSAFQTPGQHLASLAMVVDFGLLDVAHRHSLSSEFSLFLACQRFLFGFGSSRSQNPEP